MHHQDGKQIAQTFIASQEMRGHTAEFVGVGDSPINSNELTVTFDFYSPAGNLIDGPVVVVVNKHSRTARFLGSP